MRKNSQLIAYGALVVVCLVWGTTYLALRIGVTHFPPLLFAATRQLIAGFLLTAGMIYFGKAVLPSRMEIIRQAIGGFFMISLGNGLVSWAEVYVHSGIAAIICSLMPMAVIFINLVVNENEKPNFPIFLGLAVGLAGILIIFGENLADFSNPDYRLGILFIFLATLSWAGGSVWMKMKNGNSNPFINAGLQMFFGGLFILIASPIFDDWSAITWSAEAGYSLLYLILFGSILAYASYSYAINKLPMTIVSLYAYINPLVAVVLGWLVLGEKMNIKIVLSILVTVAGIYLVNRGYQLRDWWRAQLSANR